MSEQSSLLLLGIGTSGVRMARGIYRAFGEGLRFVVADTDAASATGDGDFTLLGGDRLAGCGAGGDVVAARLAAEDSIALLDAKLEGVRLVVVVTALGGGTGGGATLEAVKHLSMRGLPTLVFATTPFAFEGDDRQRNARGVMPMLQESANACVFLPLDKLVSGEDNMEAAMRRAVDTVASGVTLFWRVLDKPGYIRLDAERLRHILTTAGRGRFACVTVQGADRASEAVDKLIRSELLATASAPVQACLCGILAGEDLRLSEIGRIANGLQEAFGTHATFDLGTVNDEQTFCGRLSVVVLLFEASAREPGTASGSVLGSRRNRKSRSVISVGPVGRGRFNNAEPTNRNGEDLDIPTFVRHNINLDF